jgi:hypothetical protein
MVERVDAVNRPRGRIRYGWPLHSAEWDAVPDGIWESNRWQSRPLGHASKSTIPTDSGVYMMCVRPPRAASFHEPLADLQEVIYVGKSRNLRRRYAQHLNTPSPKVQMARKTYSDSLRFWFLNLSQGRYSTVESMLIDCFGPAANDKPGELPTLEMRSTRRA